MSSAFHQRSLEIMNVGVSTLDPQDGKSFENRLAIYTNYFAPATDDQIRLPAKVHGIDRFGTGYDEMYPTRLLKKHQSMLSLQQRAQVFSQRVPTKFLVWPNTPAKGVPPISGHVPALKSHTGGGNRGTMTSEHNIRDARRERSIEATFTALGALEEDPAMIARLATIKHMIEPSESLAMAGDAMAKHGAPAYTAHSHIGDVHQPTEFRKLLDTTQEARETMKWATGALMSGSQSHVLVPPVMTSYLKAAKNDWRVAMSQFRHDVNTGKTTAPNSAASSATDDLTTHSLPALRTTRGRALSDARALPAVKPPGF